MKHLSPIRRMFRFLSRQSRDDNQSVLETDRRSAAESANTRGDEFLASGDLNRAAECYQEAIRILPSYAEAHVNLGVVLGQLQRYDEAEALFSQAAVLKPALWQAHLNRGIVAEETKRPGDAIEHYLHVLRMRPSYLESSSRPDVHWRLANLYASMGQFADALRVSEEIVVHSPSWIAVHLNIGAALSQLGRDDEALAKFEQIVSMDPQNTRALRNAGILHQRLGHWEQARTAFARAIVLDPDYAEARMDLAFLLLLLGEYEEGWTLHEQALPHMSRNNPQAEAQVFRKNFTPEKYWNGENLEGKKLLVWSEQGLGETLMMLRYMPLLKARGAGKIMVCCSKSLDRIVRDLPEVDEVVLQTDRIDDFVFDRHCSVMSLPFACETRVDSIPNQVPYISIPAASRAAWHTRLALLPGLRVGLAWSGDRRMARNWQRSVSLKQLAALFAVPGISWINLQKDESANQLKEVPWPIHNWMSECNDFQDTGALMQNLDLVITVCTSVVHLAGALGLPTLLLNRYESDWRWFADREVSPWYPTVRIFRQPSLGNWEDAVGHLADELRSFAGSRPALSMSD